MTPEYLKEILDYNPETGDFFWKKKINRRVVVGKKAGSISGNRVVIMINYKNYKAHIIAWAIYYNEWPDKEIDHKDTNSLNNKIENLRKATRSQNAANTNKSSIISGYKGVSKSRDKWLARIRINGKQTRLGLFDTPKEAAMAYDTAAMETFGEFARTNFGTPQADKLAGLLDRVF